MAAENNDNKAVKAYVKVNFPGHDLIFSHGKHHILHRFVDTEEYDCVILSHVREFMGRVYLVRSSCVMRSALINSTLSNLDEGVYACKFANLKGETIFETTFPIKTELGVLECIAALDRVLHSSLRNGDCGSEYGSSSIESM